MPRDPRVAADPELAQPARSVVGVERLRGGSPPPSRRTPRRSGRPRSGSRIPPTWRPPWTPGNSENEIVPSAESSTGQPKNSPPGMFAPPASTMHRAAGDAEAKIGSVADDANLVGRVEPLCVPAHSLPLEHPSPAGRRRRGSRRTPRSRGRRPGRARASGTGSRPTAPRGRAGAPGRAGRRPESPESARQASPTGRECSRAPERRGTHRLRASGARKAAPAWRAARAAPRAPKHGRPPQSRR